MGGLIAQNEIKGTLLTFLSCPTKPFLELSNLDNFILFRAIRNQDQQYFGLKVSGVSKRAGSNQGAEVPLC